MFNFTQELSKSRIFFTLMLLLFSWQNSFAQQNNLKPQANLKKIKVGAILPLSGAYANLALPVKQGLELFLKEHQELASTLFFEDNFNCDGAQALGLYRKLVNVNQVDVIVTFCAGASKTLDPIAAREGKLLLSVGDRGVAQTRSTIQMLPQATDLVTLAAEYYASMYANVIIVGEGLEVNLGEKGNFAIFKKAFEARGGKVLQIQELQASSPDTLTALLLKIKQQKPAALVPLIFDVALYQQVLMMASAIRLWEQTAFAPALTLEFIWPQLVELHPKITSFPNLIGGRIVSDTDEEFKKRFAASYGTAPSTFADYGYDIAALAYRCANSFDCVVSNQAPGVSGSLDFDLDGVRQGRVELTKFVEGKFLPLRLADIESKR